MPAAVLDTGDKPGETGTFFCRTDDTMNTQLINLMGGTLLGAAVASAGFGLYGIYPKPNSYTWLYYSQTKGETNIGIRPDGSVEIGPHYDRSTEAKKLFEMVDQMIHDGRRPDCHETGYDPLVNGEKRIYPGPADPPPVIFQQRL